MKKSAQIWSKKVTEFGCFFSLKKWSKKWRNRWKKWRNRWKKWRIPANLGVPKSQKNAHFVQIAKTPFYLPGDPQKVVENCRNARNPCVFLSLFWPLFGRFPKGFWYGDHFFGWVKKTSKTGPIWTSRILLVGVGTPLDRPNGPNGRFGDPRIPAYPCLAVLKDRGDHGLDPEAPNSTNSDQFRPNRPIPASLTSLSETC